MERKTHFKSAYLKVVGSVVNAMKVKVKYASIKLQQ